MVDPRQRKGFEKSESQEKEKNLTNQVRTSDLEIIQLQSHALPTELW